MESEQVLYHLLRLALGIEESFSFPSNINWQEIIDLADKHGVSAIAWDGVQRLYEANPRIDIALYSLGMRQVKFDWFGSALQCEVRNDEVDNRCRDLFDIYSHHGMQCCVLKGQGVARLYPIPNHRQSGDIDLWVLGDRNYVLSVAKESGARISHINVKHAEARFSDDVPVELHFTPGFFYNPIVNRRLAKWFEDNSVEQCNHYDEKVGFSFPTISFNLVYLIYHLFQHFLFEGVGLRQVTDYCCTLLHSDEAQRSCALEAIEKFRMGRFCGGLMWVMQDVYGLPDGLLLCAPDAKEGRLLLDEFLKGAGFGRYDERNRRSSGRGQLRTGMSRIRRASRFLAHYPGEVLFVPLWKLWHWGWRAANGYLKT